MRTNHERGGWDSNPRPKLTVPPSGSTSSGSPGFTRVMSSCCSSPFAHTTRRRHRRGRCIPPAGNLRTRWASRCGRDHRGPRGAGTSRSFVWSIGSGPAAAVRVPVGVRTGPGTPALPGKARNPPSGPCRGPRGKSPNGTRSPGRRTRTRPPRQTPRPRTMVRTRDFVPPRDARPQCALTTMTP